MARMKFLCDADRCIECNACVTACKNENEVPWGINRRRVVTINDGKPGERSVSMACMHCTDAPCAAVCPVSCFFTTADSVVLDTKSYTIEHPAGRDWRHFHEVTLRWIAAIAILGMLVLLVVFYLTRGMVRIESGRSGRTIVRFTAVERFVHWMTATCFIILAITGLNITF